MRTLAEGESVVNRAERDTARAMRGASVVDWRGGGGVWRVRQEERQSGVQ